MSKKSIIISIIVVMIIVGATLGYLYINKAPTNDTGDDTEGTNFLLDLFTFGRSKNTTDNTDTDDTNTDVSNDGDTSSGIEMQKMKLLKISSMPIAGYTVFPKERYKYVPDASISLTEEAVVESDDASTTPSAPSTEHTASLRYVAKANGNIYQTFADEINERRLSDMIVPKVEEAFFGNMGSTVIMRYIKENILTPTNNTTISTFTGSLPKEVLGGDTGTIHEVSGSFLPENITDMSISPDFASMFYLYNVNNTAVGTTASVSGSNKSQVFDSGFTEWLSQWPNMDTITITSKPSANVAGYMYKIDPNRKNFSKVLGGINGLTTLTSPSGKLVLYGNSSNTLSIYHIDKKENTDLLVRTLPEKCVWSGGDNYIYCAVPKFIENNYSYPDSWYMGEVSFSDDIWKINVDSGTATRIVDPLLPENQNIGSKGPEAIDGIKLQLDEDAKYLFFINKKDSHLWGLDLK